MLIAEVPHQLNFHALFHHHFKGFNKITSADDILVGGFNPSEKYDRQIGLSPQVEVKINKYLKSPPSIASKPLKLGLKWWNWSLLILPSELIKDFTPQTKTPATPRHVSTDAPPRPSAKRKKNMGRHSDSEVSIQAGPLLVVKGVKKPHKRWKSMGKRG